MFRFRGEMMKVKYLALAIAALGNIGSAVAADSELQQTEKIIVTGSNIKRIGKETASPVQVIKREEIARTGATTLAQFIDTLTASTAALDDIGGSNSFASGASGASLRNLGKAATLVLLNSRRLSHYALGDGAQENFTNLDALPVEAIERVEILKDGASAIYGSDAIAGVINVITRNNFQGLQLKASHEQSITSGMFPETSASITGGMGDLSKDGYNLLVNLDLYKRDSVMFRDTLGYTHEEGRRRNPSVGTMSTYAGNILYDDGSVERLANCPGGVVAGAFCRFDQWARIESIPKAERSNLFASGSLKINSDVTAFGDLGYSRTKTTYKGTPPAYGVALGTTEWSDANGNIKIFTPRGLPGSHPLNDQGSEAEFRYRFADAESLLKQSASSDQVRLVTGLKGSLDIWDWEGALGYLSAETKTRARDFYSVKGFKEVIGDYDLTGATFESSNFFNKAYQVGQQNSAEVLNKLFPEHGTTGKTNQIFVDGKISGILAELSTGDIGIAAGFDLRRESFKVKDSDNIAIEADIVGLGSSSVDAKRTYGALFAELSIPFTKDLEAQVAARVDKFPNFSAHVSPKLGLRYQAAPSFLLRGTYAGGFRAPNLLESSNAKVRAFAPDLYDPKRCDQAVNVYNALSAAAEAEADPNQAAILQAQAETIYTDNCNFSLASTISSNPDLKPETSRSHTLGFVFEPSTIFSIATDFWHIERKNEITTISAQDMLLQEAKYASEITRSTGLTAAEQFANTYLNDPTLAMTGSKLIGIRQQYQNVAKTRTSGIDVDIASNFKFDKAGKLRVGLETTYMGRLQYWSTERNAYGDNLAGRYEQPRLQAVLSTNWEYGAFDTGLRIKHTSGYATRYDYYDTTYDEAGCADLGWEPSQCRVASSTTVDASLGYTGIKNLSLLLNIGNLLNRKEPLDLRKWREDSTANYSQAIGRTAKITVQYKFF